MMANQTGVQESAADRAYRRVREDVLRGVYLGGAMLSEATLAAELGLSRTPVRAALVRLQEEGWLTIYPKRGAQVQTPTERAVREMVEAKVILESEGIAAAADAARITLVERAAASLAAQAQALSAADLSGFVELSIAFHRGFVEAAGNGVLLELYDRLADRQRFLLFSYGDRLIERADEVLAEHRAMIDAARDGDAQALRGHLREHLRDTYGEWHWQP